MNKVSISRHINDSKPIERTIAEKWSELTPEQFASVSELIFSEEEPVNVCVKTLALLLDLPAGVLRTLNEEVVLSQLISLTDFIRQPYDVTDVPFHSFEINGVLYHSPAAGCLNLRALEFNFAEDALSAFYENRKDNPATATEALWKLMAILYREGKKKYDYEKNPDGDCRQPYNDHTTTYHARQLAQLPVKYAYATLMWYMACRAEWQKNYPEVFPEGDSGEAPPPIPGYFMLMRSIAEKGTYGSFKDVEQMYVLNMFNELVCVIAENERLKEMQNEHNHDA